MAALRAKRITLTAVAVFAIAGGLAYLRDPAWLGGITEGLGPVETDAAGARSRTMGGHASFFVAADAHGVTFPLRIPFDTPADWPVTASITLDDTPVDRLLLSDDTWRTVRFRLPPRGTRRFRRVDIRVDRTRAHGRGPQVGEVRLDGR